MSQASETQPQYSVKGDLKHDDPNVLVFNFTTPREEKRPPKKFIVSVDLKNGQKLSRSGFDGANPSLEDELSKKVDDLLTMRSEWIERMELLAEDVRRIASSNGWSTRCLTKKLGDSVFGDHEVPVVMLQKDLCQLMLTAHGRIAPGVDGGVAGVYRMPSYDDAVSLYFYKQQWHIHHESWQKTVVATVKSGVATPFGDAEFAEVLKELHASAL